MLYHPNGEQHHQKLFERVWKIFHIVGHEKPLGSLKHHHHNILHVDLPANYQQHNIAYQAIIPLLLDRKHYMITPYVYLTQRAI